MAIPIHVHQRKACHFEHYAMMPLAVAPLAGYFGFVNNPLLPLNPAEFHKMAHGDTEGLVMLADEYFVETRRLIPEWRSLVASGEFNLLRDELHRCKGGASLFGLERMVALLGKCESASFLETHGFDMSVFETELDAAENAVAELTAGVHNAR